MVENKAMFDWFDNPNAVRVHELATLIQGAVDGEITAEDKSKYTFFREASLKVFEHFTSIPEFLLKCNTLDEAAAYIKSVKETHSGESPSVIEMFYPLLEDIEGEEQQG